MKKIFTILGITAMAVTMNAQNSAFKGADFENWSDFTSSLNSFGLKSYATQNTALGQNSTNSLNIKTDATTTTSNDYVFTALATANYSSVKSISFYINGVADKALSINLYMSNGTNYNVFNATNITSTDITLTPTTVGATSGNGTNQYIGSIDTGGNWVKVTLDLTNLTGGINTTDAAKNFIAFKIGKSANYNINIDNIMVEENLAVADFAKSKISLVKNSVVSNEILFGAKADVKIYNMNGQLVKSASVNDGTRLDVSSFAKGIYIVAGEVEGQKVSEKIIKK